MNAMRRILPDDFEYDVIMSVNSTEYQLCENETFFFSDRPCEWRNKEYRETFISKAVDILTDRKPRCIKVLGYFQDLPLCPDDAQRLWSSRILANYSKQHPEEEDMSIYLRCTNHYFFNDLHYYESILNNTVFEKIWLFLAPECRTYKHAAPLLHMIQSRFKSARWYQLSSGDGTDKLLHDLAGLIHSSKLILPSSSWAFWAGFLSNASEVHVNAPPLHPLMPDLAWKYIYHNQKRREYFGKYNISTGQIEYKITPSMIANTNANKVSVTSSSLKFVISTLNSSINFNSDSKENQTLTP